jgi:hypothetical protein
MRGTIPNRHGFCTGFRKPFDRKDGGFGVTISAKKLIGANVKDRNGEPLGHIHDLVLDSRVPGGACYVMILLQPEPGRRAGRTIALPWSLLNMDASLRASQRQSVVLDLPRSALRRLRTATV